MLNRTHEIRFYKFFLKILYIGFLMIFVMFEIVYSIFAINGLTCKVKSFDFPYNRSTWYFVSINGVGSKLKVGAGGELDLSEIFLTSIKKNVYFCNNKKVPLPPVPTSMSIIELFQSYTCIYFSMIITFLKFLTPY